MGYLPSLGKRWLSRQGVHTFISESHLHGHDNWTCWWKYWNLLVCKPMNLYLCIPPHFWHAPGVLSGLVFGSVLCIYQLCSRQKDIDREICLFIHCILDRGYNLQQITPLFAKAIENAKRYLSRSNEYCLYLKKKKASAAKCQVFYHLPYHPNNPPYVKLQQLWRDHMSSLL